MIIGGKAKSSYRSGMLKVTKSGHRYINVMKLESYDCTGEWLNNNH
jgi:hypothetical protein